MWSRLHVKFANKIIAVSEANKNALPVNDKTVVIYDPLPENETRCRYEPRECLDKRLAILYLANYTKGKGHIYALKILKEAIHKFPGWSFSLDFYGGNFGLDKNDRYRKSLEVFVKENDLKSNVKFHDETKAIEEVMKAHDLVLNLSDSESFSRVTLEALFYGIPIVATDVGGTREMVLDGQTGVLVQPKNVSAMSGGFEKLITNDTLRNFLASNAYNLVRERFSNRNTVEKMEETYKNVGN
jgi:glycosyltransferase involved in cell wall biosynthesis